MEKLVSRVASSDFNDIKSLILALFLNYPSFYIPTSSVGAMFRKLSQGRKSEILKAQF